MVFVMSNKSMYCEVEEQILNISTLPHIKERQRRTPWICCTYLNHHVLINTNRHKGDILRIDKYAGMQETTLEVSH